MNVTVTGPSGAASSELRFLLHGLWLPLITPFRNGALDETSLKRLVRHYADKSIDGLILGATSGEGMTLADDELMRIVALARAGLVESKRDMPILLGMSGSNTRRLCEAIEGTAAWPIDGYLIASPYYSRPSQRGLLHHFEALANCARLPVVLYNIPYRTAVNLANDTLLELARHPNIIGLKDCCADRNQTLDLLGRRPANFKVLTGEDAQYFEALGDGADGAILLSAHVETESFSAVHSLVKQGKCEAARAHWEVVSELTRLLFAEPSPAAAKYWLFRTGLINSAEVRLPMVEASAELAARIDAEIARRRSAHDAKDQQG